MNVIIEDFPLTGESHAGYQLGEILNRQCKLVNDAVTGLQACLKEGLPQESLKDLIETTKNIFEAHFSYQESLMDRKCYPDLEDHRWRHTDILERIGRIGDCISSGNLDMATEQTDVLVRDLTYHTDGADRMLAMFVRLVRSEDQETLAEFDTRALEPA